MNKSELLISGEAGVIESSGGSGTIGVLIRKTAEGVKRVLPFFLLAALGACGPDGCNSSSSHKKEEVNSSIPTFHELTVAQGEMLDLFGQFMKQEFNVQVPLDLKMQFSKSEEAYQEVAKDDDNFHSVGFYKDRTMFINYEGTRNLVDLLKVKKKQNVKILCSTLDAVGTVLHEGAHGLTKDFQRPYDSYYGNFSRAMYEALATEVEDVAPEFLHMIVPGAILPENCMVGPAIVDTDQQRFHVIQKSGAYQDFVQFETYLFDVMGECDDMKGIHKGWAHCALRALMHNSFDQSGASRAMNAIMKKNKKCNVKPADRVKSDGALLCGEAPYLQYALSRCDGGEELDQVVCSEPVKFYR